MIEIVLLMSLEHLYSVTCALQEVACAARDQHARMAVATF